MSLARSEIGLYRQTLLKVSITGKVTAGEVLEQKSGHKDGASPNLPLDYVALAPVFNKRENISLSGRARSASI